MPEIVWRILAPRGGEEGANGAADALTGALGELAHVGLEFAVGHLDRVEIGRIHDPSRTRVSLPQAELHGNRVARPCGTVTSNGSSWPDSDEQIITGRQLHRKKLTFPARPKRTTGLAIPADRFQKRPSKPRGGPEPTLPSRSGHNTTSDPAGVASARAPTQLPV